jgi:hypothetical protein
MFIEAPRGGWTWEQEKWCYNFYDGSKTWASPDAQTGLFYVYERDGSIVEAPTYPPELAQPA